MLATADRNGGISIWDPDNGQELFTLAGHKTGVTGLSWRGDSKLLASCSEDGRVKLWEMQEGKQAKSWNAHDPGTLSVSYSLDGHLVTCGRDNAVTLWEGNGNKVRTVEAGSDLPLRAVLSYDAKRVFAADFSGHVLVWTAEDGKKAGELDPNPPAPAQKVAAAQKTSAPQRAATKQKSAAKSPKPGGQSAAAASSN
jgi:WD40 repeat protein